MLLLFALLDANKDVVPGEYQGPAWVVLGTGALYLLRKCADLATDYLSAKRIQRDEERLKKEAAQVAPTAVPFIPESLEARIFRLEKDKLETELRELRADNELRRVENTRLNDRNSELQDDLLLEQRKNADLRIDLRRERDRRLETERDSRNTEPTRR